MPHITPTLNIKIATIDELAQTAALFDAYRQFYEQAPDIHLATQFIRDRMLNQESVILLAINQDQLAIGFCQLYPSFCSVEAKPIYVLYDLFVTPDARRSGAGMALLQHAALGWIRDEVFYAYSKHIKI